MNKKFNKFETFCWGAFTAVTIMGADNILNISVPLWVKFLLAGVVLGGWGLYLLYGKE